MLSDKVTIRMLKLQIANCIKINNNYINQCLIFELIAKIFDQKCDILNINFVNFEFRLNKSVTYVKLTIKFMQSRQ